MAADVDLSFHLICDCIRLSSILAFNIQMVSKCNVLSPWGIEIFRVLHHVMMKQDTTRALQNRDFENY
jgi:hypothetical protein